MNPGLGRDKQREMCKVEAWAVVILFRMQTARSAGPYKTEPCGINDTSPEPFCVG
jgi:hypothetical protein